jgi:hypothetical protein
LRKAEPNTAFIIPVYKAERFKNGLLKEFCKINNFLDFDDVIKEVKTKHISSRAIGDRVLIIFFGISGDSKGKPRIHLIKSDLLALMEHLKLKKKSKFCKMGASLWPLIKSYLKNIAAIKLRGQITFVE